MTKYVVSGQHGRRYHTYHTDKNCFAVHGELHEATENILDAYDMTECKHCAGTNDTSRKPNGTDCPITGCDKTVDRLPQHIQKEHNA